MQSRRISNGLACRAAASLFALLQLAAQPLQQGQGPHKQAKDYNSATKCEPAALRVALSAQHVIPDVQGCAYQVVSPYFLEFGGHAAMPRDEVSSLTVGLITHQDPPPGTPLANVELVMLYVSSGTPPMVTMPGVVGSTAANARATLQQAGLHNVTARAGPSERPKGIVYMQAPDPGSEVQANASVQLGISQGEPQRWITMPSVVGYTEANALTLLKQLGLQQVTAEAGSSRLPRGMVYMQTPDPGHSVPASMPVQLGISRGLEWPPVVLGSLLVMGGGLLAVGGGWWLRHRLKIARTRRLLKLKPSCDPDGATSFTVAPHFNAPTVTLRSRLDDGGMRSSDDLPVLHVEIRHE